MGRYFQSPLAVLERSRALIIELEESKLADDPADLDIGKRSTIKKYPKLGVYAWVIDLPELPLSLSAIAKDIFNNLRSALDHAAYSSAVTLNSSDLKNTKFPFGDTKVAAESNAKAKCKGINEDVVRLMLSYEPYKGGNNLLWNLNKARNAKEHCMLMPISLGPAYTNFRCVTRLTDFIPLPHWSIVDRQFIIPIASVGEVAFDATFNLSFGDVAELNGQPAITTFRYMANQVEQIIMAIEARTAELVDQR